jgi:kynureninase
MIDILTFFRYYRLKPDVVRLAPIALYTTYRELWRTAQALREIIDTREYREIEASGMVT